jgi:hypothetical protein
MSCSLEGTGLVKLKFSLKVIADLKFLIHFYIMLSFLTPNSRSVFSLSFIVTLK